MTSPPGFEDQLLPTLANAAWAASRSCAGGLPKEAATAELTFTVEPKGSVLDTAASKGGEALSGCIARQLAATTFTGLRLTGKTGVRLYLVYGPKVGDAGLLDTR